MRQCVLMSETLNISEGSGSDRTIASKRQITALSMLQCSFTPQTNFFSSYTHKKDKQKNITETCCGLAGKLYICNTFLLHRNTISWPLFSEFAF